MAKRLTDSEKWKRPWFRSLPNEYKLLWIYILDSCDIAGIWYVDIELASFLIGSPLDMAKAIRLFSKQIDVMNCGSKWFIRDFIKFQYGELRSTNNLHRSVLSLAEKSGASQGLVCPPAGAKDKNKDKDKEGGVGETKRFVIPSLDEVSAYCQERKNGINPQGFIDHYQVRNWMPKGYTQQMKDWKAAVRTWEKNNRAGTKTASDDSGYALAKSILAEQGIK